MTRLHKAGCFFCAKKLRFGFALELSPDGPGNHALIRVTEVGVKRGGAAQAVIFSTDGGRPRPVAARDKRQRYTYISASREVAEPLAVEAIAAKAHSGREGHGHRIGRRRISQSARLQTKADFGGNVMQLRYAIALRYAGSDPNGIRTRFEHFVSLHDSGIILRRYAS